MNLITSIFIFLVLHGCTHFPAQDDKLRDLPILRAVLQKNCSAISSLVLSGAKPNQANSEQVTPLMMAAFRGSKECVEALLQVDADPHLLDADQRSALYYALEGRFPQIVEILVHANAQVGLKDRWGLTPLMLSSQSNDLEITKLLLARLSEKKLLPEKPDENGWDALFLAVSKGHSRIAKELISNGFPVDRVDSKGVSLAHLSVDNEDLETLKLLVRHKAPLNLKDHKGQNPLQLARQINNKQVLDYLKKNLRKY